MATLRNYRKVGYLMSKRRLVSILAIVAALLLVPPTITSVVAAETSKEPITLTLFDKNTGDAFTNPVSLEIVKRTGISIEVQQPTGNPDEKLNLMLSSGDLPDIVLIDRRVPTLNRYIEAGALIPLNDLIEQYAPNLYERYGDVLAKSAYKDGKNYYFNNWYGVDPDPNWAFNMRMDILEEFGYGERAKAAEPFTQEEFLDLLRKFKEKYPGDALNPGIPLTVNADYLPAIVGTFKAMYGLKNYYEHDGVMEFLVRDPKYLDMMKFMNTLYTEGLLDSEWGITNATLYTSKIMSGRVFAVPGGNVSDANAHFRETEGSDTNKLFYMFKVTAPGVEPNETTYGPRSSLGWDGVGITVKNKFPVETIKFLDFLASEEGQYLLMWGLEGVNWNMVDGVHTPTQETLDAIRKDWAAFSKESGVRKWTWMIRNGLGEDGTPYDLIFRYNRDEVNLHGLKSMAGANWDTALYDDIGPRAGTIEALAEQKIKDLIDSSFAAMVNAASHEEVEKLYADLIKQMDDNDAAKVEKIYTENYNARKLLYDQAESNPLK